MKSADLIGHIKFLPWRQLDGCSMTRPFRSAKSVTCKTRGLVVLCPDPSSLQKQPFSGFSVDSCRNEKFSVIPKILHKKSLPGWHSVKMSSKVFWSQIDLSFLFIMFCPGMRTALSISSHLPSPPFCLSPLSPCLCYWSVSRSATVSSVLSPPTSKRMKSTTTSMTRLLHTLTLLSTTMWQY